MSSAIYWFSFVSSSSQTGAVRPGNILGEIKNKKTIPIIAMGMPTGLSSNMESGSKPNYVERSLTIMLVDVPISVQVPARIDT